MTPCDRLTQRASAALILALKEGRPPEGVVLNAHRDFARKSAETWFLGASGHPNALALRHRALQEQVDAVEITNTFFFGDERDLRFDEDCRAHVVEAFNSRAGELFTGWTR